MAAAIPHGISSCITMNQCNISSKTIHYSNTFKDMYMVYIYIYTYTLHTHIDSICMYNIQYVHTHTDTKKYNMNFRYTCISKMYLGIFIIFIQTC